MPKNRDKRKGVCNFTRQTAKSGIRSIAFRCGQEVVAKSDVHNAFDCSMMFFFSVAFFPKDICSFLRGHRVLMDTGVLKIFVLAGRSK